MKAVVLNVSVNAWYPRGGQRLAESLRKQGFDGDLRFWTNQYPPGSPTHEDIPYAFKLYAFKAARLFDYDIAIWLDSSMYAVAPIDPIIEHIAEHGAALWRAGWSVGDWAHDQALVKLELTRDAAMKIPLLAGGICGFDLRNAESLIFLNRWLAYASDGVTFPGPWKNEGGNCSADPRCLGHRHDMPPLSVLAHRAGIKPIDPPKWFAYFADPAPPEALILARGM